MSPVSTHLNITEWVDATLVYIFQVTDERKIRAVIKIVNKLVGKLILDLNTNGELDLLSESFQNRFNNFIFMSIAN